jgi:hypothetical protein
MKTKDKEKPVEKTDKSVSPTQKQIKTDMPLSEKDEVKDAERRTQKASKNHL